MKWTDSSGPVTRLLSPILSLSPQGPDILVRGNILKMLKLSDVNRSSSVCLSVIYQLLLLSSAAFPYLLKLNASQAQAGTESGPATAAEITVQSPSASSEDSALFLSPSSHDDIVTSDIRSQSQHPLCLCCATLLCTVAWGRKEASRISREILENTERAWTCQQRADCLLSRRIV